MLQLRCGLGPELRSTRRLLFTSSPREVYEIVDAKQTPTSGVAITSRIKKLNFPPFIKVIDSSDVRVLGFKVFFSGYFSREV